MQNVALQKCAIRVNDLFFYLPGLMRTKNSAGGGNRTPNHTPSTKNTTETEAEQSQAKPANNSELQSPTNPTPKHKSTKSKQEKDKTLHQKCALCVQKNQCTSPDDLNKVVEAWDDLPEVVKVGILAMVDATQLK
jgi:hypothetical protein